MDMKENKDQIVRWAMQELWQSTAWKILVDELKKCYLVLNTELLEVREGQDKPVYTKDQLLKRQLHYLEYLINLPNTLVKTTTTYYQDLSSKL